MEPDLTFPVTPEMLQAHAWCPRSAKAMLAHATADTAPGAPHPFVPARPAVLGQQHYHRQLYTDLVIHAGRTDQHNLREAVRKLATGRTIATRATRTVNDCGFSRLREPADAWLSGMTDVFIHPPAGSAPSGAFYIMFCAAAPAEVAQARLRAEMLLLLGSWKEYYFAHGEISTLYGVALDTENWTNLTGWQAVTPPATRSKAGARDFTELLAQVGEDVVAFSTSLHSDYPQARPGALCRGCPETSCEYHQND